jgi:hypothetical protein
LKELQRFLWMAKIQPEDSEIAKATDLQAKIPASFRNGQCLSIVLFCPSVFTKRRLRQAQPVQPSTFFMAVTHFSGYS